MSFHTRRHNIGLANVSLQAQEDRNNENRVIPCYESYGMTDLLLMFNNRDRLLKGILTFETHVLLE